MIPPQAKILHFHNPKSFQSFFKNHPKHLHKLNIKCTLLNSSSPDKRNQILQNLIKISKKSKNIIKSLQFINLSKNLGANPGQLLQLIKRFYRVKSLGLFWDFYDLKIQQETSKWLKYTRNLHYILFKNAVSQPGYRKPMKEAEKAHLQRLENMKRTKIIKITHSDSCGHFRKVKDFPLYMDKYPKNIQEISISLENPSITLYNNVSMNRFSCLRKLELLFPLDLKTVWMLLKTLPNPQILTYLGFYLKVGYGEFDREIMPILNFIMNCPLLEKLTLQINYHNPRLKALRLPPQNKLKILNFEIFVSCDRHVREIGAFLLTAGELENLNLTVNFSGHCEKFSEFCEGLAQLTHLKKLCLKLNVGNFIDTEKISLDLINSIACLDKLEEITLFVPEILGKEHAGKIFEVLSKIAGQMKKVELEFHKESLNLKIQMGFFDLLGKMKKLKDLKIEKFSIEEDKENLLKFKQVLEGMESLEKIYWKNFVISEEGCEILFEMIISLLERKGVEELVLKQNHQWNLGTIYKKISFEEVLKINPWLKFVNIESQIVRGGWFSHNFDACNLDE